MWTTESEVFETFPPTDSYFLNIKKSNSIESSIIKNIFIKVFLGKEEPGAYLLMKSWHFPWHFLFYAKELSRNHNFLVPKFSFFFWNRSRNLSIFEEFNGNCASLNRQASCFLRLPRVFSWWFQIPKKIITSHETAKSGSLGVVVNKTVLCAQLLLASWFKVQFQFLPFVASSLEKIVIETERDLFSAFEIISASLLHIEIFRSLSILFAVNSKLMLQNSTLHFFPIELYCRPLKNTFVVFCPNSATFPKMSAFH